MPRQQTQEKAGNNNDGFSKLPRQKTSGAGVSRKNRLFFAFKNPVSVAAPQTAPPLNTYK